MSERRDEFEERDRIIEERKTGPGTGPTSDAEASPDEVAGEGGDPAGGDPHSGDPTGTGRPLPRDHDLDPDEIDEEGHVDR